MRQSDVYTAIDQKVLLTLLYFDIFDYPLKKDEIANFLHRAEVSGSELDQYLDELVAENLIYRNNGFYSLRNDPAMISRRRKGNLMAERMLPLAFSKAKVIARFPFVRAVMASGSLSKGYMDERSDLDFFVVCEPGRLWIARTLLVMFKRVFYFNSHKYFCVNYFIDTDNLEIEEKNVFTATEVVTLIPLYNKHIYNSLIEHNGWVGAFIPNFRQKEDFAPLPEPKYWLKGVFEKILNPISSGLDDFFMKVTLRRWERIYCRKYSPEDFAIAFKSRKNVSKNHPNHYQAKVLELFNDRLKQFGNLHNIRWQ